MGLRVGVIGTGRLGREHVRVLKRLPEVDHVGCYDIVQEKSESAARAFSAEAYSSVEKLMEDVDAVSVVVPTIDHMEVSLKALEFGNDLFLEKPIAASVEEARRIVEAARQSGRVLQVGHIERFNAAVRKSLQHIVSPSFIEIHRLAPFTVRGIDVSVVMDLMIHDIDLLCFFLGGKPVDVRAKGAGILTDGPDIVNARLQFEDGCVANLTASRVSLEPMRKVRIFTARSYLSIDLLKGDVRLIQKGKFFDESIMKLKQNKVGVNGVSLHDFVKIEETKVKGEEPLFDELQSFCRTIDKGEKPPVTGEDGLRALEVATEIQRKVNEDPVR